MESLDKFKFLSPTGQEIYLSSDVEESTDPYLKLTTPELIRNYYLENGYVVCRNLISSEACDLATKTFSQEVRPYEGFIYRQTTANPEKHDFCSYGFMQNPLLNIQSLQKSRFKNFRDSVLSIYTDNALINVVKTLLEDDPTLVQSMFFDGNPSTVSHQDTYYLDSEDLGRMIAAWIALEDIQPGAGRFYIYPKSHKLDIEKNSGELNFADHHDAYLKLVLEYAKNNNLECRVPVLRKGDVLFWNSKTIHGSLKTFQPNFSRRSLTAHYIPSSKGFLQFQAIPKKLHTSQINGVTVHCPKNLNHLKNQFIFFIETTFPKTFRFAKKLAIRLILK